ncbi:hypothetical protein Tco_0576729 [Tanacetum coccineum]
MRGTVGAGFKVVRGKLGHKSLRRARTVGAVGLRRGEEPWSSRYECVANRSGQVFTSCEENLVKSLRPCEKPDRGSGFSDFCARRKVSQVATSARRKLGQVAYVVRGHVGAGLRRDGKVSSSRYGRLRRNRRGQTPCVVMISILVYASRFRLGGVLHESPLQLPTEEPILGYLKFSAKGTKREVFRMIILNELIIDDIRGEDNYDAYLKKVAKHHRYLVGEEVSDPGSPAPKLAKSTKPKITKQAKLVAPKAATKKPQPAPTKHKEKKLKPAKESTEATPPAKRAKAGKVAKKRTLKRSQQLVDEFVDEGILLTEPGFGDLETDTQRAIEESLKDAHGAHWSPLPPVVFRETNTGKYQPLPEVEGKGKEKVGDEQAARVLLNLQTLMKKSPTEQYIFQRRTSAPIEPSGHDESSSLYAELGLTESDTESDEEVPPIVKSGAPDEGQAGPNPGNDTVSQTLSTPGVHAGPNLEHTDAEATDATSQPQPGQMDEELTAIAYPNIQENLKLTVDDPVILEEPANSTGTLSSLQHLAKDFSFGD